MTRFHCMLVTPLGSSFNEDVWQVTIPGPAGRFSLRSGHAPVISSITGGQLEIARSEKDRLRFIVGSGIIEMSENHCRIMTDSAVAE